MKAKRLEGAFSYEKGTYKDGAFASESEKTGTIKDGDTIRLKAGEAVRVKDLPVGTRYEWTEDTPDGYTLTGYHLTGTLEKDTVAEAVNTYASETNWSPNVTKILHTKQSIDSGNMELEDGEFRFHLTDVTGMEDVTRESLSDGKEIGSASNKKDGSVSFAPVIYTEADDGKTYTYAVWEEIPDNKEEQMQYDATVHTVTVTPKDNGDGTMSVTAVYDKGLKTGIRFENSYISQPVPTGLKSLGFWFGIALVVSGGVGIILFSKKRKTK